MPVETWAYHSPRLAKRGILVDLGGVAEALVYYDRLLVNVQSPAQLAALISWFHQAGELETFIRLLKSGALAPYHFAFDSLPLRLEDGTYQLWNVQGKDQVAPDWFERGVLKKVSLRNVGTRQRRELRSALCRAVIEVKSAAFEGVAARAQADCFDPSRAPLLIQALYDDVHDLIGLAEPPEVKATVKRRGDKVSVTWNVDMDDLGRALGLPLGIHSPMSAAMQATRSLWAASTQGCDLFMGSPLSRIVGDRLFESASRAGKPQELLQQLQAEVEFPDLRSLVNTQGFPLREVLHLRRQSGQFRTWLQTEGERDRNAIFAYHFEVAKEAGVTKFGRKTLSILSTVGASIIVAPATAAIASVDPLLAASTQAVGTAVVKHVLDGLSRSGQGWRPVVFGDWAATRIKNHLAKQQPPGATGT